MDLVKEEMQMVDVTKEDATISCQDYGCEKCLLQNMNYRCKEQINKVQICFNWREMIKKVANSCQKQNIPAVSVFTLCNCVKKVICSSFESQLTFLHVARKMKIGALIY